MSKTALITGATSGIGKATAEILAKTIIKLSFAVDVKTEWLNEKELSKLTEVHTLLLMCVIRKPFQKASLLYLIFYNRYSY
jgi:NAD(P)-dependent dehydrogenase (short-subunit alcohol dehydrogenase family)